MKLCLYCQGLGTVKVTETLEDTTVTFWLCRYHFRKQFKDRTASARTRSDEGDWGSPLSSRLPPAKD